MFVKHTNAAIFCTIFEGRCKEMPQFQVKFWTDRRIDRQEVKHYALNLSIQGYEYLEYKTKSIPKNG